MRRRWHDASGLAWPGVRHGDCVPRKPKPFLLDLYSTALGKKYVMAITGIIGIGFVIAHMVGNLKMYLGQVNGEYEIDVYSEHLRELLVPLLPKGWALWILRIVLISALALHLHAAYSLTLDEPRARPVKYQAKRDYIAADFAARTMRWSGIIVLLFLCFHLADLTWGWFNPGFERGEVYRNVDASLSRLPVAILYIVANIALGIHLFHGTWSLFQSARVEQPTVQPLAPQPRHRDRHDHRGRQLLVPDRRAGRHHLDLRPPRTRPIRTLAGAGDAIRHSRPMTTSRWPCRRCRLGPLAHRVPERVPGNVPGPWLDPVLPARRRGWSVGCSRVWRCCGGTGGRGCAPTCSPG